MRKQLLFLFAALLPLVASAQTKVEIDGIWYNLTADTHEAEVTSGSDYSGSITIPATVTYDDVTYSVTSIGEGAFWNCSSLTSIILPESVTSIGYIAFDECTSLTTITIPEGVTSIGDRAFLGCSSLTDINIPESMTSIGDEAFSYCNSLTAITCHAITPPTIGGLQTFYRYNIPVYVPSGAVEAYKAARYWANFSNIQPLSNSIASGTCGDGLTWVLTEDGELVIEGTGAMYDYSNSSAAPWQNYKSYITSVDIKEGVTSVGSWAFSQCSVLTDVSIAESVTSICGDAFRECSKLEEITLPGGLTELGTGVFLYCFALKSVVVPEGVTKIGSDTFEFCPELSSITFPSNLTEIGPWALKGAYNLASITCKAVTPPSLGIEAFSGVNTNITVYVPTSSVEAYKTANGWNLFTNIQPLSNVIDSGTCGDGLTWTLIDDDKLIIEGTGDMYNYSQNALSPWNAYREMITTVTLSEGVTSIGDYAFYDCSILNAIIIPESVTSIGWDAFQLCYSLTAITIPEGMTSIGNYAFRYCGLTAITIPEGVTSIEKYAFYGCSSLTAITCHAMTPPTIGASNTFNKVTKSIPVYVPAGSVEAYKAAEYWSEFTNIQAIPNEFTLMVSAARHATLYLDYAVEIPDGVEVFYASSVEDDRLKMTKVTGVLPANTGVIVRAEEGTYTFTESDETPETIEGNLLVGTTTKTLITTESGYAYYVLAKKDGLLAMYKPQLDNGQFYNMANKAYLVLKMDDLGIFDEETNTDEEGGQLSNRLRFDFGGTTDIEKTMDNRQQATDIYDLHGRRITDAEGLKGIYIVNGRKVIFK